MGMNSVAISGRISNKLELSTSKKGIKWTRFSIAINNQDEVDFIDIVCFDKTAEALVNNLSIGSRIGVNGYLKTGSYEHEKGVKIKTLDVVATRVIYYDSKPKEKATETKGNTEDDDDLPF